MIWDINSKQNTEKNLSYLAARKKTFEACNFWVGCSFFIALGFSVFAFLVPSGEVRLLDAIAILSLIYSLVDTIYIGPKIAKVSKQNAGLTETFDCSVFDIPINEHFRSGLSTASIEANASAVKKQDLDRLKDWYDSALGSLPITVAAVVAQCTSTGYDQGIRKLYLKILWLLVAVLVLALAVLLFEENERIRGALVSSVVPFLPLLVWLSKAIISNSELVSDQEQALLIMESQWASILDDRLSGSELAETVRDNQDALYVRRSNSILVFPWLYLVYRPKLEARAAKTAKRYVEEYTS